MISAPALRLSGGSVAAHLHLLTWLRLLPALDDHAVAGLEAGADDPVSTNLRAELNAACFYG
jgi:hypothetical protein